MHFCGTTDRTLATRGGDPHAGLPDWRLPLLAFGFALAVLGVSGAEPVQSPDERRLRERYEQVLLQNPFQERAFHHVFDSYLNGEGVARWIESLKPRAAAGNTNDNAALLLLGQIYDRQFNPDAAIDALERAGRQGEARPDFKALLGMVYFRTGNDDRASVLLGAALDATTDLERRSALCRTLGSLYLRQGKRDQAVQVWKRIADQGSDELFARQELTEIYEDNQLWEEAIAAHRQIAAASKDDPYRQCRALRSAGHCLVQMEKHHEAIAAYEQALALVSPGNWLFEDLKGRLVSVYEDTGDLAGLVKYLQARMEQTPGDPDLHELMAETYVRMSKFDLAEQEHQRALERTPRATAIHEKLIALYTRQDKTNEVVASLEKLSVLFPSDTDYVRRLGEWHFLHGDPEKARGTWQRIVKGDPAPARFAELAGWYDAFKLPNEAIQAYEQALKNNPNKDWVMRLALLKLESGAEAEAIKLWLSVLDPSASKAGDYAEVAAILEANQKFEAAANLRRQAAAREPDNLEHRLAYARTLMKLRKFKEALEEFSTLADQTQNDFFRFQGESGRIDAYAELGVLDEKRKEWEKELESSPKSAKHLVQLARVYERTGQREKAVKLYERRRDLDPSDTESLRMLAEAYKSSQQIRQAIEAFQLLLEKDKLRARVYLKDLLDIHLASNAGTQAVAVAERIVALAPADAEARLDLAQVYVLYLEKEKGFEQYRHALRLAPNEPEYHRHYGEALVADKRWAEALAAFRKMLDTATQDQTRINAVQNMARIHVQQGAEDALLTEFHRRVRNTPKKLAAYEELAAIHVEMSQGVRALEVLENGLQAVEDKSAALRSLIRFAHQSRNLPKMRGYFEQLIALSGKPSLQDYEKLAELYAQSGEPDKAKATWYKMVELAPADGRLMKRLASTMRDEGFAEEALALQAKSVDAAPYDYQLRFAYAQALSSGGQPSRALDQLLRILELGERDSQSTTNQDGQKQPRQLTRGRTGALNPYTRVQSVRRTPTRTITSSATSTTLVPLRTAAVASGLGGLSMRGGWQGSFTDFKPQLVSGIAGMATQCNRQEEVLKSWKDKSAAKPEDLTLKRELLLVLLAFEKEEATKLAEEILAAAPADYDIMHMLAQQYQAGGQLSAGKAMFLLETLAKDPEHQVSATLSLIQIHTGAGRKDKATALAEALLADRPTEYMVLYQLGNSMIQLGATNVAKAIYERGLTLDPRYRRTFQQLLVNLYRRMGDRDQIVALYKEMLFAGPTGVAATRSRGAMAIYQPMAISSSSLGRLRRIPNAVMDYVDASTNSPLAQLVALQESAHSTNDVIAEMEKVARNYKPAMSPAERNRAWDAARMLIAHYFVQDEMMRLEDLLKSLRQAGKEDIEWYNVALYINQFSEKYDAMLGLYGELSARFPGKARDILLAKARLYNMARRFEDSAKAIRELNRQPLAPRDFLQLVQPLTSVSFPSLSRPLMEEYLATGNRSVDVLAAYARICAREQDYDRATELICEALDRRPLHPNGSPTLMASRAMPTTTSSLLLSSGFTTSASAGNAATIVAEPMVREAYTYHSSAKKIAELVQRFQEKVEQQPNSIQLNDTLAQLYWLDSKRDLALDIYQSLAKKYPHLLQAKVCVAKLLTDRKDYDKAIEQYEAVLKQHPEAAGQVNSLLRSVRTLAEK